VFGVMLNFPVSEEPAGTPIVNGEPHIAGSVGFIGRLTGVVFVYSTASFARRVTKKMLGSEDDDSGDEIVNDAFGEITNMVVGHIKSRLADKGTDCVLTIPSILRASHITIKPLSSMRRRVSTFRCGGSQVVVEVILRTTTPQEASFAV